MFPSRLVSVLGKGALENNYSLVFDGSDDYVDCGNDSSLSFASTEPFSISAWVYYDTTATRTIISKGTAGGADYEWRLFTDGSSYLSFACYSPAAGAYIGRSYDVAITTGRWYHVSATYDGGTSSSGCEIYLDGVAVSDADYEYDSFSAMTDNGADVIIGKYTNYFDGKIDEVAIWNTALSAGDISALYQARGTANLNDDGNSANLQGWWRMGDGVLDSHPLIADQVNPTLGSEEMTNSSFDTDSDWAKGTGWTITGGQAIHSAGSASTLYQGGLTTDKVYKVVINAESVSGVGGGDGWSFANGGVYIPVAGDNSYEQTAGIKTYYFTADNQYANISCTDDTVLTLNSISVKEIGGNPGIMTNMTVSDIVKDTP